MNAHSKRETWLNNISVVYLFFPETARLSLEEIAKNFGDEVAVHVNDATEEEKMKLDKALEDADPTKSDQASQEVKELEVGKQEA